VPDDLAFLVAELEAADRGRRLAALFKIGEVLAGCDAGGAAPGPEVAAVIARIEAIAHDRAEGSWIRKRARRALEKIRGGRDGMLPPEGALR
jgi:hypothetical protein